MCMQRRGTGLFSGFLLCPYHIFYASQMLILSSKGRARWNNTRETTDRAFPLLCVFLPLYTFSKPILRMSLQTHFPLLFIFFLIFIYFFIFLILKSLILTCVPKHEPPPTSLPITSLWVIPMHQLQACCILHQT